MQNNLNASFLGRIYQKDKHLFRIILMIVLWSVFMALTKFEKFYTPINFQTMASQFPEFGLMALGIMLCMLTGGIDLSVVGVANLTSILMALLMKAVELEDGGLAFYVIPLAFVLAMGIGAAAGALNGFLVSKVPYPADPGHAWHQRVVHGNQHRYYQRQGCQQAGEDIRADDQLQDIRSGSGAAAVLCRGGADHLVSADANDLRHEAVHAGNLGDGREVLGA